MVCDSVWGPWPRSRPRPPSSRPRPGPAPPAPTRWWLAGRILLALALVLLVLSAVAALRPVSNPGIQECGPPLVFLASSGENRLVRPGDTGRPDEEALVAQPECRARAVDEIGRAARLFAAFVVCAALGAAAGLVDDRLALRRAPPYETLLRELPLEARARRGLVPRVTVDELGAELPPVEKPEIAGIVAAGVIAPLALVILAPPAMAGAALADFQLLPALAAVLAAAASVAAAAELRVILFVGPADRPERPWEREGRDEARLRWLLTTVAGGWLAAIRPLVGASGVDLHRLRRQGRSRAQAVVAERVLVTMAVAVHLVLLVLAVLAEARSPEHVPPAYVHGRQLIVAGAVIVLVATGLCRVPARWRGLPVRPSWRGLVHLHRVVPAITDRLAAAALTLARPVLAALVLAACLATVGAHPNPLDVLVIALLVPVAVAVSPTPAGAGTVEAVLMLLLMEVAGVDSGRAAIAALAFRGLTFWLPMIPGYHAACRLQEDGSL